MWHTALKMTVIQQDSNSKQWVVCGEGFFSLSLSLIKKELFSEELKHGGKMLSIREIWPTFYAKYKFGHSFDNHFGKEKNDEML